MQTGFIYDGISSLLHSCVLNASRYTGKERDAESGLDYFGARYYASNMGRWMSPDWADKPEAVPYSSLDNPQSLNLYGYVYNNPLSRADADGHWPDPPTAAEVVDFTVGVTKGIASSMTFGILGAPSSSDSYMSLAGQGIGTSFVGGSGTSLVSAAVPGEVVGLAAAPETLGGGLVVSGAAALGGVVGAGMAAGAAKNSVVIAATVAAKSGSDVVTSSGQKADQYGNKLGGSGKPQQHETQSNTREGSNNKSLNEGNKSVNHSNPKSGQPHTHAADADGNKKPNSTHHNYPD